MSSVETASRVWNQLISNMNQNPSISDFAKMNGFLKDLTPQLLSDDSLILSTDNDWAKRYIESTYKKLMSSELEKIMGHHCEIIVISDFQEEPKEEVRPQVRPQYRNSVVTNSPSHESQSLFSDSNTEQNFNMDALNVKNSEIAFAIYNCIKNA